MAENILETIAAKRRIYIEEKKKQVPLKKLVSQSAVNLEIDNTDSIDGIIDAIIKANDNLTDSNTRNDWEMMGEDIKKLQDLINLLDKMRENNSKKKTENVTTDTNEITTEKIYE